MYMVQKASETLPDFVIKESPVFSIIVHLSTYRYCILLSHDATITSRTGPELLFPGRSYDGNKQPLFHLTGQVAPTALCVSYVPLQLQRTAVL